jgi:hypothetical protein
MPQTCSRVDDGANEEVVSTNGLCSDKSYVVYFFGQPNRTDANMFDISTDDSATRARLNGANCDIVLYKNGKLVPSLQ